MAEIACFPALLMGLRSHKICNQGNKYMEMCRTILCTWAPAGGSKGERPLPPGKLKKKKKSLKEKNVQTKFTPAKGPHRMLCEEISSQKAPMLCVKYSKRPPCYALNFCLKRPPYVKL